MKKPEKKEAPTRFTVAAALQETGLLLELQGGEPFRARAYARAARAVAEMSGDLGVLISENRLTEIKSVGRGLAAQIQQLYNTGRLPLLERLRAELPPGVSEISRVLSVKKIEQLHQALGITSVAELRAATEAGKIRNVPGFGVKAEQKILEAIDQDQKRDERILLLHASRLAQRIVEHMRTNKALKQIEVAGSVRRSKETVSTLRIVAGAARQPPALIQHFLRFQSVVAVEEQTQSSCQVILIDGVRVSCIAVSSTEYAVALHHETGSQTYVEKMRNVASTKGFELNERSLRRIPGLRVTSQREAITVKSEGDIFAHLGMQYIAPELREDEGEIELALAGKLPEDLITIADIRGMTHCHTTYSDGKNSVEEMARAAEGMGMHYITITDHSPTAFYANGVKLDRLKRQWDEIDRVQEKVKVKLLRGTESDILRDGALDYPDLVLERFDVIIASIHNRYKMNEAGMTRRLLTAMKNPFFKIWGHPLGRLIQRRPPFACRVEEVLDAIAESRAAIEINGDPHRLDM